MSGPNTGRYYIVSDQDPTVQPVIGTNDEDRSTVRQLEAEGLDNMWFLERTKTGKYTIMLQGGWHTQEDENLNVVANKGVSCGQLWSIRQSGDEDNYTIERDSPLRPNYAWTLSDNLVVLRPVEIPYGAQRWRFISA